jgi:hypothetical protein
VTYILVIATLIRELATRESGCIFALVIAGGSALTMPYKLLRLLASWSASGRHQLGPASVEQGS